MGNEISASIVIKTPIGLDWINSLVQSIYKYGKIYAFPLNRPRTYGGEVQLPIEEAYNYFRQYIQRLQENTSLPVITWVVRNRVYEMSLSSKQGYLALTIYLFSDRMQQDEQEKYPSFQYYIQFLMEAMKDFPIIKICMWYEDDYVDMQWHRINEKWVGLKIQDPPPETSFQVLNCIIRAPLTQELLEHFLRQANQNNFSFLPLHVTNSQQPFPKHWTYICDGTAYDVSIQPLERPSFTQLIFHAKERKDAPHIDSLVNHALKMLANKTLEQIMSFDSRYNYLIH